MSITKLIIGTWRKGSCVYQGNDVRFGSKADTPQQTAPLFDCLVGGRVALKWESADQAKLNQEIVVQEILKHHDPSNLVMITHDLYVANVVLEDTVPMGEFFVLQPNGADFDVIGKIRMGD